MSQKGPVEGAGRHDWDAVERRRAVSAPNSGSPLVAVVHGNNVAYLELSRGKPKVANLIAVRHALEKFGCRALIWVDDTLVEEVDDPARLKALINEQTIRRLPAGADVDEFLLKTAQELSAPLISNERFSEYQARFPWLSERRVPLKIVGGNVEFNDQLFAMARK
jgi:hypothetical protein